MNWSPYRFDIINYLIQDRNYKRYLEIGVNDGSCFEKIKCRHKDGVDPGVEGGKSELVNYPLTSDDFFSKVAPHTLPYDIIFIDGLHLKDQVDKDIENSLRHLNEGGVLVLHDTHPWSERETRSYEKFLNEGKNNSQRGYWLGTTWQSVLKLRTESEFLKIKTVMIRNKVDDADVSIVEPTKDRQELYPKTENMYEYSYFKQNKEKILNLISVEEFLG